MDKPKAHVASWKKDKVSLIKSLAEKHKTIGIIDITNLPSYQMQKMRSHFNNKGMVFIIARLRLIKRALSLVKDSKKNIHELEQYIKGIPAIIFLNEDPFKLAKFISKNKSAASAKPGQIAPNDLYIPAGPTPFTPGPIIGELGQLGIKTSIEAGKISVKEATRIVKQGDVISDKVAAILSKLGIQPMEIGINLVAVYEDGIIYKKDVLTFNEKEFIDNIKKAHRESLNLALNTAMPIQEVVFILIKKAYLNNLSVANKINFEINKEIKSTENSKEVKHTEKPREITIAEIKKASKLPTDNENFEKEEKAAQDVLLRLQNQKLNK